MRYNTVIIGGGLAGLTAAATLSKFGKKVLLLEQHYKPGGCATSFKRGDFMIEVGLHEMSGLVENGSLPRIFDMLDVNKEVGLLKVPEFYAVHSNNETFVFPHGFDASLGSYMTLYRLVRHNRIDSDHFHSVILRFTNSHESVNTEIALNPL